MSKEKDIDKAYEVWRTHNSIEQPTPPPALEQAIDRFADFFLPGRYYYYIVNFIDIVFDYVNPNVKQVLGIDSSEFTIQNFLSIHHPDDLAQFHKKENIAIKFLLERIQPQDILKYKVMYMNRVQKTDGTYIKLLHQTRALRVSEDHKIQHVLGVHTDISHFNTPITNRVSFIGDEGYDSFYSDDLEKINVLDPNVEQHLFSPQEIRIIKLIAEGMSTHQIAKELFISESTVKTHRKNILKKSNAENSVQLVVNCLRAGII